IFEAGFSTTEEVTDVSGRGVGMDVVSREIESLRGNIHIDSERDRGTTFTIELPLTVAIIDGLVSRLGEERMIFPVSQVVESINPDPDDVQWMQERGRVVQFRDEVIPVIDPGAFIDKVEPNEEIHERTIMVVVRTGQEHFAIWIDRLISHEQVVIKG
ncbi:MAG: chemotaxis protein CheW, partial [bacterium]